MWTDDHDQEYVRHGPLTTSLDPAKSTWPQQVHLRLRGFSIPFSASLPTSPLTAVVSWEEVYDADGRMQLEETVECVRIALQSITAITEDECHSSSSASVVNLDPRYLASDGPGRSRFDIGEEQLYYA